MIPTDYKATLPKRLSYPLGAAVVSDALSGVPQYDYLRLRFRDHADWSAMQFQTVLRERRPFVVLAAVFDRVPMNLSANRSMVASGWYDKKWEVIVYAVLRDHRHAARVALLDNALPAIRKWLSQPSATRWESGHRRLEFKFDPAAATVTPAEFGETLS